MKRFTSLLLVLVCLSAFLICSNSAEASELKVNNVISFGAYEQDGKFSNGSEPIQWIVAKVEGKQVLLVSKYALFSMPFSYSTSGSWEDSPIREWLNEDFLTDAFTKAEQDQILMTRVENYEDPFDHSGQQDATWGKIFLLSTEEITEIWDSSSGHYENRGCSATDYVAGLPGVGMMDYAWTRTTTGEYAWIVFSMGDFAPFNVNMAGLIRPAMWVVFDN